MVEINRPTFVIEFCVGCKGHQWNTRHDEAKYMNYFTQVSELIKTAIPDAECLMNRVPKVWHEKDIYCSLIPNYDD